MSAPLRADGLLRLSPATIFTFGGGTIEPLDPDPDDIYIEVTDEMQESLSSLSEERTVPIVG